MKEWHISNIKSLFVFAHCFNEPHWPSKGKCDIKQKNSMWQPGL